MTVNAITRFSGRATVKELRVEVRLKNNRLIRLREELGLKPMAMAKRIGVGYQVLLNFENLRRPPTRKTGDWRPSALRIAAFHGVSPSYCWPAAVRNIQTASAEVELSAHDAAALVAQEQIGPKPISCDPEQKIIDAELVDEMESAFEHLKPRERNVLTARFGLGDATERNLQDIAGLSGCSAERIRQVEAKGLNKLRRRIDLGAPETRPLSELDRVRSALTRVYAVAHAAATTAQDAAFKLAVLVTRLSSAQRHAARTFELELRRDAAWCCMNPYCPNPWRSQKMADTECCSPCREQLSTRDRGLEFSTGSHYHFPGLRRWEQKAKSRRPAGYCF